MEQRLKPVESYDLSKGLNTYSAPSNLGADELSTSENIRHKGPGRIIRRNGMKKFHATGVLPTLGSNYPSTIAAQTKIGRLVIPYIQQVNESSKRSAIMAISVIGNSIYYCRDNGTMALVALSGGSCYARIAWRPRYTTSGIYYDNTPDIGAGFLDNRIYIGSSLEYNVEMLMFSTSYGFPFGCRITVTTVAGLTVGVVLTQAATGAIGTIGYIDSTNKRLYLYDWNGINFSTTASHTITWTGTALVPSTDGGDSPIKYTGLELSLAGLILDYDTSSKVWSARKWGIDPPIAALGATEGASGVVPAGTFNIKYTFIKYVGGSLSSGDNPKLSGGTLVSESAPSPVKSLLCGGGTKISIDSFDIPADPQVTHVRVYRDEYQLGAYHHVCDIAIADTNSISDNYNQATLELEAVSPVTDGYKTFGQSGEYSGDIIETAQGRIFVAGNKTYPQKVYFSAYLEQHQHTEYFSSSTEITESPGESITAMKFWNGRLFVFMERSVFELDYTVTEYGSGFRQSKLYTKGIGCATRNGIIDNGSTLLVMTDGGLCEFNGSEFGPPLTIKVESLLGTNLLHAIITRSGDYVYIVTETLRTANKIVTLKYSDGSWACGVDVINSNCAVPDCFSYVPCLTNFGNTVDDSDYILGLFRSAYGTPSALHYYLGKYDLASNNKDLLMKDSTSSVEYAITAKFSPRIMDLGAMADATIEKIVALINSSGDTTSTENSPTGEFTVRGYVDYADDGMARLYTETKLINSMMLNQTDMLATPLGQGPIQNRLNKALSDENVYQFGGIMSDENPAQGITADHKIVYEGCPQKVWGRLWRVLFEYSDTNNFEFTGFAIKFIRRETT